MFALLQIPVRPQFLICNFLGQTKDNLKYFCVWFGGLTGIIHPPLKILDIEFIYVHIHTYIWFSIVFYVSRLYFGVS